MVLGVGAAGTARADDAKQQIERELASLSNAYGVGDMPAARQPPRVAVADSVEVAPRSLETIMGPWGHHATTGPAIVGLSGDGAVGWVAMDVKFWDLCGMEECRRDPAVAVAHGAALFEASAHGWQPVVWDFARVLSAKEEAAAKKQPPPPIAHAIERGAEDVAKQFEADLASAAALAKAVSERPDAVLYGSALKERFVGGAAVRAQLIKWKLGFKVRDGVLGGLTSNKAVAWMIANVDAAKPGDKAPTAYRLLAVYEKAASGWRIVQLTFAIPSA